MNTKIILGIDPGLRYCGYSIIKRKGRQVVLLDYGYVTLSPKKSIPSRLSTLHSFFGQKIIFFKATDISLETPFLGKNAQNFLKLGYVRGILYLLANNNDLKIHEFTPRQVKVSLTGFGGASKEQVARVIMNLFPRMEKPKKEDVTDALAVTLCGLWNIPRISETTDCR